MSEDTNSAPTSISSDVVEGGNEVSGAMVVKDDEALTQGEVNATPPTSTSVNVGTSESSDDPKPKIEVVKVEKAPEEQLSVIMGRQNTDYWTNASWPKPEQIVKSNNIVIRGDGIYELRKTPFAYLCVKKSDGKFVGFPKEKNPNGFFALKNGRIPYSCLQKILHLFKSVCDDSKNEVYSQIFRNDTDGGCGVEGCGCTTGTAPGFGNLGLNGAQGYFIYIPVQKVSGGSVNYTRDQELEARHTLPCEIHSHNTMGAFFSGTDDEDEKADRFYGVVGELNKTRPAMSFSFVCGGKRQYIDASHLFTEAPEEKELFPQEWLKRIEKSYLSSGGYGPYSQSSSYGATGSSQNAGPYRFQPANGRSTGSTGGSSGSLQGRETPHSSRTETREEIASKISRAAMMADGGSSDDPLRPIDILSERKATDQDQEVPGDHPFFHENTKSRHPTQSSGNDEILAALVGQVEETIMQAFAKGIEMTDPEKREMFSSLISGMNEVDIGIFLETIVDHGHVGVVIDTLQTLGDDFDNAIDTAPDSAVAEDDSQVVPQGFSGEG